MNNGSASSSTGRGGRAVACLHCTRILEQEMNAVAYITPQDRPPPSGRDEFWQALDPEPPVHDLASFSQLAVNCVAAGASDLTLQTDQPVRCQVGPHQLRVTRRPYSPTEIDKLLVEAYGSAGGPTLIAARRVLDFSWQIPRGRGEFQRFRVNATGVLARRGGNGLELTFRALPAATPSLDDVGLDPELWPLLSPPSGLVVVAGATGQGKSTTLAALIRQHMTEAQVKIVDIQAPIEFTYSDLSPDIRNGSSLGQSEVGTHIETFAEGVRSALRRSPDIVVIGEVRDSETARAAVDAAMTGHLVYTTVHSGDVPEIFRRLQALLSGASGERTAATDILQTFRAGIAQRLLPSVDGLGRHPVREIAILDGDLRRRLAASDPDKWPSLIGRALHGAGGDSANLRPFGRDVRPLLAEGRISPDTAAVMEVGP